MATKRLKKPRRRRSETRPKTSRRPFSSGRKRRTDSSSVRVNRDLVEIIIIIDRAKVSSSFESSSQTFLSLAGQSVPSCDGRPSASAAFESSFDDVSFVRLSVGGGRSRSKGSSTPYRALALVASRLASLGHDDDASAGTSF